VIGLIKRILPYMTILCAIAAVYAGATIYSRHKAAADAERDAERTKAEQLRRDVAVMGTSLKILSFYGSPAAIRRGEKTLLCFGVANAKTVTVEPPVDGVWPTSGRCVDVAPIKTTTYKITASDGNGHSVTQDAEIEVRR
jgi:hypothetical protein